MTTIGETLRRERLRRNLDLKQVSDELKISVRFLQDMEAGNFEKLPGGVFAKAFVRQYAQLLELDADEIAKDVQHQLEPQAGPSLLAETPHVNPTPISVPRVAEWESVSDRGGAWAGWSSTVTALGLVVVVMLICSGVYAFWQRPRHSVSVQESVQAAAPAPVPVPQQPAAQAPPAMAENPPTAAPSSEPAAQKPETTPTTAATVPDVAAPRGAVHVELSSQGQAWIRAQADGKYVFSGTMEPNQSRTFDAESNVVLRLGNAGAVTITLNGKQLEPVGPPGQVRTVQLTSGGFQIVAPPKAPDPLDPL